MGLNAEEKHRCMVQCNKHSKNNTRAHTDARAHTHRNCFPVVALGKLKLHYGPPEGGGERGWRKRKRERKCGKGESKRGGERVSCFLSLLAVAKARTAASRNPGFWTVLGNGVPFTINGTHKVLVHNVEYLRKK